jgi:DNA repair photolyase
MTPFSIDLLLASYMKFHGKTNKRIKCKTLLVDVTEYPLNFLIFPHRLTANTYVGCTHECFYYYTKWYRKPNKLKIKINAPEILRKELQKK